MKFRDNSFTISGYNKIIVNLKYYTRNLFTYKILFGQKMLLVEEKPYRENLINVL